MPRAETSKETPGSVKQRRDAEKVPKPRTPKASVEKATPTKKVQVKHMARAHTKHMARAHTKPQYPTSRQSTSSSDSSPEVEDDGSWRNAADLSYTFQAELSQSDAIKTLTESAFTIPPRLRTSDPWTVIECADGTTTVLPRRYRLPLLYVAKFLWESVRLVLTSATPEQEWEDFKYNILYVSRLCNSFLKEARDVMNMNVGKGMDKSWRSATFNRALTRIYHRWMIHSDEYIRKFWVEFGEEEYERDILKSDWGRFVLKGHRGFCLTKSEVETGLTSQQLQHGLTFSDGKYTWNTEVSARQQSMPLVENSTTTMQPSPPPSPKCPKSLSPPIDSIGVKHELLERSLRLAFDDEDVVQNLLSPDEPTVPCPSIHPGFSSPLPVSDDDEPSESDSVYYETARIKITSRGQGKKFGRPHSVERRLRRSSADIARRLAEKRARETQEPLSASTAHPPSPPPPLPTSTGIEVPGPAEIGPAEIIPVETIPAVQTTEPIVLGKRNRDSSPRQNEVTDAEKASSPPRKRPAVSIADPEKNNPTTENDTHDNMPTSLTLQNVINMDILRNPTEPDRGDLEIAAQAPLDTIPLTTHEMRASRESTGKPTWDMITQSKIAEDTEDDGMTQPNIVKPSDISGVNVERLMEAIRLYEMTQSKAGTPVNEKGKDPEMACMGETSDNSHRPDSSLPPLFHDLVAKVEVLQNEILSEKTSREKTTQMLGDKLASTMEMLESIKAESIKMKDDNKKTLLALTEMLDLMRNDNKAAAETLLLSLMDQIKAMQTGEFSAVVGEVKGLRNSIQIMQQQSADEIRTLHSELITARTRLSIYDRDNADVRNNGSLTPSSSFSQSEHGHGRRRSFQVPVDTSVHPLGHLLLGINSESAGEPYPRNLTPSMDRNTMMHHNIAMEGVEDGMPLPIRSQRKSYMFFPKTPTE